MSNPLKIAIVGAGPAGLTLARLLHMSGIDTKVTVYERDSSRGARRDQGGTLDLHEATGLRAIRKCGLWDQFSKYARFDEDEMRMADKYGTIVIHKGPSKPGENSDRPEIDRKDLRDLLLESVSESSIMWNKKLSEVTEDRKLVFDEKEVNGPFDLIVGAEGGWSKVRNFLTPEVKSKYAGVSGYELDIIDPATKCPALNEMVGRGSFGSMSDGQLLNAQRVGTGNLKVRSWFKCAEGEAQADFDKLGPDGLIEKIKQRYSDWDDKLKSILDQPAPESLRVWTLYELPVGFTWNHRPGFTLLGDAASLATPFSGQGVNKAMTDSLALAELIITSQEGNSTMTLDEAIQTYEKTMFPRAHSMQALTENNKQAMFNSTSPAAMLPRMLMTMVHDKPWYIRVVVGSPLVSWPLFSFVWVRQQIGRLRKTWWRKQ